MARNKVYSVRPLTKGNIADGTEVIHRFFSDDETNNLADRWAAFDDDNAQWRLDNPGAADPSHCVVVNPASITTNEKTFVRIVMFLDNDLDGRVEKEQTVWHQMNTTNYPGVNPSHSVNLKLQFDAEVTRSGLDPV